jgi:predicted enzyme involved in methoxymalonyl-ACP biosynthesis
VICRTPVPALWEIDTWLMSCRVLGRRVEEAVLAEVVAQAVRNGVAELRGRYIASGRNAMVADHYRLLGFRPIEESTAESVWSLMVSEFSPPALPFEVEHPVNGR